MKLGVSSAVAVAIGIGGALFFAGPALFADGSDDERMAVVAILASVLGVGGFGLGFAVPTSKKLVPWFLAAPTVLLSAVLAWDEGNILVTALLLVAGAIGFSLAGVWLGARIRLRRASAVDGTQSKTP